MFSGVKYIKALNNMAGFVATKRATLPTLTQHIAVFLRFSLLEMDVNSLPISVLRYCWIKANLTMTFLAV